MVILLNQKYARDKSETSIHVLKQSSFDLEWINHILILHINM